MIQGQLIDENESKTLYLRISIAHGKTTVKGKEIEFSVTQSVAGEKIFVEFPGLIKVAYTLEAMVQDALDQYEKYLSSDVPKPTEAKE